MHTDKNLLEADLTETILGACFEVLNGLDCGFLESLYQKALFIVLQEKRLSCQMAVPMVVAFHNTEIGQFIADIVVERHVILEIKAAKALNAEHEGSC